MAELLLCRMRTYNKQVQETEMAIQSGPLSLWRTDTAEQLVLHRDNWSPDGIPRVYLS